MAFPNTSVLDDFNRANSASLGASWGSPIESGFGSLAIVSNQAAVDVGFQDNYWLTSFAANQEAFVTLTAGATGADISRIFARLNTVGGNYNGYGVEFDGVGGSFLFKVTAAAITDISGGTGATMANGDSAGISCSGSSISHWKKPSGGSWGLVVTATDSTYPGSGFIGLQGRGSTLTRFDDFGGGNGPGPVVAWITA